MPAAAISPARRLPRKMIQDHDDQQGPVAEVVADRADDVLDQLGAVVEDLGFDALGQACRAAPRNLSASASVTA